MAISTYTIIKQASITRLDLTLPVKHGEEEIPDNFPGRSGNVLKMSVILREGRAFVEDWPPEWGETSFFLTVKDEGRYRATLDDGHVFECGNDEPPYYVPHSMVPGEYGDVVAFEIDADGRVPAFDNAVLPDEDDDS